MYFFVYDILSTFPDTYLMHGSLLRVFKRKCFGEYDAVTLVSQNS